MIDVQESVAVPASASAIANALSKFAEDALAAKKSGLTGTALVAAIGASAIADLATAITAFSTVSGEVTAEPIGVAEAFVIAGIQVARSLTGK